MKKILALMICVLALGCGNAMAQKGVKAVGVNFLYGTEIEKVGVGVKLQYGVLEHLRLEGAFNYFFKKNETHMWEINVNAHYLFPLADGKLNVYPLAGPTIVNATTNVGGGLNQSTTKFGLNLGGGLEYNISEHFAVGFEARYSIVSKIDQAVFNLGATYRF